MAQGSILTREAFLDLSGGYCLSLSKDGCRGVGSNISTARQKESTLLLPGGIYRIPGDRSEKDGFGVCPHPCSKSLNEIECPIYKEFGQNRKKNRQDRP